jgi:phage virion morphogenesis protein
MAGVRIELGVDLAGATERLHGLLEAGQDLTPLWQDLGEHLLNVHRDRFSEQTAPDGEAWAPLSARYQRRKPRNPDKILTLDGHLRGLLRYQVLPDGLEIGTDRVYGAAHQFGIPKGYVASMPNLEIPVRPFLGLGAGDERDVAEIIEDYFAEVLGGP